MVATGSLDGFVKVWDTQTGILVATLEGPQKEIEVTSLIWNVITFKVCYLAFQRKFSCCWFCRWNCMDVASSKARNSDCICRTLWCRFLFYICSIHRLVTCGSFSQDGKTLVTGSEDGKVKIWDPKTGQTIRTIEGLK